MKENSFYYRRRALINPFLPLVSSFQTIGIYLSIHPSIGNGKIRGQLEFRTGPSATTDADIARIECSPVPKKGIERTWDTERERKREKKGGWQWLISQLHGLRHALWEDQSSSSILLLAVNEERWKEEERKKGEGKVRKKKNRKKRGWEKKSDDTRGGPSRLITIHVL